MFAFPFLFPSVIRRMKLVFFPVLQGAAVGKGFKGSGKLQSERVLKVLENKFDMNNRFKVILAGGRQYGGF